MKLRRSSFAFPIATPDRSEPQAPNPLRRVGYVLAFVGVSAALVSIAFPNVEFIDRFGPNVASESLGILVTLAFVQRVIDRSERWRRLRGSLGALRRGGRALTRFAEIWGELVKGSLAASPERPPRTLDELFVTRFTESLALADPGACLPGAAGPWIQGAAREMTELTHSLGGIVVSHALTLDTEYVELVDALIDDPFLELVRGLALEPGSLREWTVRINAARADRDAFFHRLLATIECHNRMAAEAGRVRNRRTAPRTGAVGVELPLDYDLKAFLELDTDWWRRAPAPSALRGGRASGPARRT